MSQEYYENTIKSLRKRVTEERSEHEGYVKFWNDFLSFILFLAIIGFFVWAYVI